MEDSEITQWKEVSRESVGNSAASLKFVQRSSRIKSCGGLEELFFPFYQLVFTNDAVGVGVVVGIVRELMTYYKSIIRIGSGVISSTELESEESERFNFF